jgi:hypothetical protein
MTYIVAVNGRNVMNMQLHVPNIGPWFAEFDLEDDAPLSGRATVQIGPLTLSGTVDTSAADQQRHARVVAGGAGWAQSVPEKHYQNDAQVKARTVAEDAARLVGETIGVFIPVKERVGAHYVRQSGAASRALEDVIGATPWWVDYEGVTRVGPRASSSVDAKAYQVLAYDPRERVITLHVDDLTKVGIGSVLSNGLDGPHTVRDLEVTIRRDEMRIVVWCGEQDGARGRLEGLLVAIARKALDGKLFGKYRYRFVAMAGERFELQAARKGAGVPDLVRVSQVPGIAGAHSQPSEGAEVYVEFVEGDRSQPIVTGFVGADGSGFVPERLTLGGVSGANAARQGDNVEVLLPPAIFSGTIGGAPATGVLTFPLTKTLGSITGGSSKVGVAT